jgi:hypothetical protein
MNRRDFLSPPEFPLHRAPSGGAEACPCRHGDFFGIEPADMVTQTQRIECRKCGGRGTVAFGTPELRMSRTRYVEKYPWR